MDPMFPSQGDASAPMLQDVRGSAKRAINYFRVMVGEPADPGDPARHPMQLIGAADAETLRAPLSYDAFEVEIDDIFTDNGTLRVQRMITEVVARFGLHLDASSWSSLEGGEEMVVTVRRGA